MKFFTKMNIRKIIYTAISLLFFIIMVSCNEKQEKNKPEKTEIVKNILQASEKIKDSTIVLEETRAIGENEIFMRFVSKLPSDRANTQLIRSSLLDLVGKIIWSHPENIKNLNNGVHFNIEINDKTGKLITKEIINKNTIQTPQASSTTQKHDSLRQMLEIFNNSLPIQDSISGVEITQISLGSDNDLIYTAIVPKKLQDLVKDKKSIPIIKDDMSKDKNLKKILIDMKNFDISSLKYEYRDHHGNLLQEIKMKENDFKK